MQKNNNLTVFIALFTVPLLGLSVDIYIPSLPQIANYFSTSQLGSQSTVTVYIFGLGVSQLIAGNIVDAFGRRIPLIFSLITYCLLCLLILQTNQISKMMLYRFMQGIVMGFAGVAARSAFTDLFTGLEYYKKASYITIFYSIGPIVAPFIGGYLQYYIGWKANFYFLLGYALIALLLVIYLYPETLREKHHLNANALIKRYYQMLTNTNFLSGIFCLSLLYSVLMLFNLAGPFLVQTKLHYSSIAFGYIALFSGLSWFIGMIVSRLLVSVPFNKKMTIAALFAVSSLTIMIILSQFWFNLYVIIIPLYSLLICSSVMFSCFFVKNPMYFPQFSATASAVTAGAFSLISSWINSFIDKFVNIHNPQPLIFSYTLLILICILITWVNVKSNLRYTT